MKLQIYIKWFLSIFFISLVTVTILTSVFPKFIESIVQLLSHSSADVVASQLSSLITVSSAAPGSIEIEYIPTREILYNISGYNRRLIIKPSYRYSLMKNIISERFYAVNLGDFYYENVNSFKIVKKIENGNSVYYFYGYRSD